jgi:tetratricopeptide (TPR) repeat protein
MPHLLILGGDAATRVHAARAAIPTSHSVLTLDAGTLPFVRVSAIALPSPPRAIVIDEIDRAFPDRQLGGTRLVLTQSTYLLQKWVDLLGEGDRIIATADTDALKRCAPEALQGRGPWTGFEIIELSTTVDTEDTGQETHTVLTSESPVSSVVESLVRAFTASDPADRLRLCREAVSLDPDCEVASLALASACRESRDGEGARASLDRAAALAPEWEPVAYERGKLLLVYDDIAQAREAFQRAAGLMPTFSAAFSNLGATLGELGEPAAALGAFRQALAHDPFSFTVLNNIGASCRELGRLEESEAAFRRAIAINPDFVFAHYNLGHTLFLAGRYGEALSAYEAAQRRDPQQNRRQGCRLAVVRFAMGDAAGAARDLWRAVGAAPADEREDLLLEVYEAAQALLTRHPALEPHRSFLDRIGAEIVKSE